MTACVSSKPLVIQPNRNLDCPDVDMEPCSALLSPTDASLSGVATLLGDWGSAYKICQAKQAGLTKCIKRYEDQK